MGIVGINGQTYVSSDNPGCVIQTHFMVYEYKH